MQCTYTEEALFHHIAKFHTGNNPYNCNKCELNFSEKVLQLKHIESVHDGNKPYRCFVCNDKFPQRRKLTIHMNKKHKEVSFKTENPEFENLMASAYNGQKTPFREETMTPTRDRTLVFGNNLAPDHEEQKPPFLKNKMSSNYNELPELKIEAEDKVQKPLVHEEKVPPVHEETASLVYEEITSNYKERITVHEGKKQQGNSYYCTPLDILGCNFYQFFGISNK